MGSRGELWVVGRPWLQAGDGARRRRFNGGAAVGSGDGGVDCMREEQADGLL
jgi:hypothetical protein